jgi:hypothetical protein
MAKDLNGRSGEDDAALRWERVEHLRGLNLVVLDPVALKRRQRSTPHQTRERK